MDENILDYKGAAKFLGVSEKWLRHNCRKEGVPHKKIGRRVRFSKSMLAQYIANQDNQTVKATDYENIQ